MKKNLLLSVLILLLSSCKSTPITKYDLKSVLYVTSDLHFLSNNLVDEPNKTIKRLLTSDGRVQEYDVEIVESLIQKVNKEQPNYLVLTGDLTFNGEYDSHLELIKLLKKTNDRTKVLVLPGNHDINNVNAKSYVGEKITSTPSITEEKFKELYADFGYQDAINYDEETLSYFYLLDDSTYGLFIDSSLSRFNLENDMNFVGGYLYENTLNWIEENLKRAKDEKKKVVSFMHHNLITHNSKFERLFTLSNANQLLSLFEQYDVSLNFSGHLHIQNIKNTKINDSTIYDICNASPLDYGNRIGILNQYDACFDYKSIPLPVLVPNFEQYSFNTFYQKYYDKSLYSFEQNYPENYKDLLDFCSTINAYYFDGSYSKIKKLMKQKRKIAQFVQSDEFTNDYLKIICSQGKTNMHEVQIFFND